MTTIATDPMILHLVHAVLKRKTFMAMPPMDLHATDFTIATCLRLSSFDLRNIILGNWPLGAQQMLLAVNTNGAPEITLRKYMRDQPPTIGSLCFDGDRPSVSANGVALPAGSPVTIEFWMRNAKIEAQDYVFELHPGACYAKIGGVLSWVYQDGSRGRFDCAAGHMDRYLKLWTHVALVSAGRGGSFMGVYLNGKLAGSTTQCAAPTETSTGVTIGCPTVAGLVTPPFEGELAELRIWDHVRSTTEIKNFMRRAPPPDTKGLLGYWPLDEGGGAVANDRSSHGHHGVVSPGAKWATDEMRRNDPTRPSLEVSAGDRLVALSSSKALTAGAWHHLAVTFTWGADRKTPRCVLYLDGVPTGQMSPSIAPSSNVVAPNVLMPSAEPYMLGWKQDSVDTESYGDGTLHHLRVFKTALSPEEIAILAYEDNREPRGDDAVFLQQSVKPGGTGLGTGDVSVPIPPPPVKPPPKTTGHFVYDATAGEGRFYRTDGNGGMTLLGNALPIVSKTLPHIVPGNFGGTTTTTGLFFYDATLGVAQFYATNGTGSMSALGSPLTGLPTTWKHIVPGNFGVGTTTGLFAYDATLGQGRFYSTDGKGGMTIIGGPQTGWGKRWAHFVPGTFNASTTTSLLFYDAVGGAAQFYATNDKGNIFPIGSQLSNLPTTWTHLVPGKFDGGTTTGIFVYDATLGECRFYSTDGKGGMTLLGQTHTGWRKTWSHVVPGTFDGNTTTSLLFYDAAAGQAQFYGTDGTGRITAIGSQLNDLPKTWSRVIPGTFHLG